MFLLRELYTTRMSEEDNLDTHAQCIHSIYQDLKITGKGLSEGNFIMALLMSLLPSWDNFISSTDISGIDSMDDQKKRKSIDAVQACIKTEWAWWKPRNNSSATPSAFNSFGLASEKKGNNKNSANVAQGGHTYNFSIFTTSTTLMRNSWMADSGADNHIIADRNSFSHYIETLGAYVQGVGGT